MKYFFLLLIIAAFALSACGEPAECEIDTDCTAQGACFIAMCVEGSCDQMPKEDCCGNLKCDRDENVCTCDKDCDFEGTTNGKCEGMVQFESTRRPGTFYDAKFAQYYCDDDCRIGVPGELVENVQYFDQIGGDIEFEIISTITEPYELGGSGRLRVNVRLAEVSSDKINTPIEIHRVQALIGNQLVGDTTTDMIFDAIGDNFDLVVDMNPVLSTVETETEVTLRFNFEYDYVNTRAETIDHIRTDFEKDYDIYFVDPSKVSS